MEIATLFVNLRKMRVKKFYQNKKAEFIAENADEAKLVRGDLIQVEDTFYRIDHSYFAVGGKGYIAVKLDNPVIASVPF